MKLGIFHKVFARPTLEESLDGVQASWLGSRATRFVGLRVSIQRH